MKKISKLFILALSVIAISACNKSQSETSGKEDDIKRYSFVGTHEFDFRESNDLMVADKQTDYKVLLPYEVDSYLLTAKDELVSLFNEATGAILDVIIEDQNGLPHTESGKWISIGDTHMFKTSEIAIDKEYLGTQGAFIETKDKTIYLNGGDTHGCVYAVYDLLEIYFNFDTCSYDCVHLDKRSNLPFYFIKVTDIPDIKYRSNSWGFVKENPNNLAYRLRTPFDFSDYILLVADLEHGQTPSAIHNCMEILPYQYQTSDHKAKWYSDKGREKQICYTAHGDEQAYREMVERAAYVICEYGLKIYDPIKYPLRNTVTFTMEDNSDTCNCPSCLAKKELYGTESGQVIVFCNDLREKIQDWMDRPENKAYRRDDFNLLFFAYNSFIEAPAKLDRTSGKYVVNHPDLVMHPNVGVYFAVSSGIQYQLGIYDKQNASGLDNFMKWSDIASSMYLWTYNANFGAYLSHVNSTNFYNSDTYQVFCYGKTKLIYNQGGWNTYNLTAFQMLAIYLDAKLSWNSNLDINVLIDRWFTYMFKDASEDMKSLFYLENTYSLIMFENLHKLTSSGIINNAEVASKACYPFELLRSWLDIIKNARKKIEPYASVNPELYKMLNEHINLEWVSPAYYMLTLYGKEYLSNEEYMEMANRFNYEILPLKYFLVSERSETINSWIISLLD